MNKDFGFEFPVSVKILGRFLGYALVFACVVVPFQSSAQTNKTSWQTEWEKALDGAKKEGKVVISIPASAEMRKQLEEAFNISAKVFLQIENQSEEKLDKIREPALKVANALLK